MTLMRPLLPNEAARLGVDWGFSLGKRREGQAGPEFMMIRGYGTGLPGALRIRKAFNLGNHVRQVLNAIRFAELSDIDTILLPRGSIFSSGKVCGISLLSSEAEVRGRLLEGTFFYPAGLGLPLSQLERDRILLELRSLIPRRPAEVFWEFVAHLRAGDVFDPNPHPKYGPPPLRFYLDAIMLSGASRILIVSQSLQHPYIPLIAEWCRQREIEIMIQCSDLKSDFAALLNARTICVSQGTLSLAAAWLSDVCRTAFTYEREREEDQVLERLGMQLFRGSSPVAPREWDGSENQLKLLADPDLQIDWSQ